MTEVLISNTSEFQVGEGRRQHLGDGSIAPLEGSVTDWGTFRASKDSSEED